jgi:hypothetical protein
MKQSILITIIILSNFKISAQSKKENEAFTYAEFRAGYGATSFGKGLQERYNAGNYSSSGGGLASLAAYRKLKKINYANFGIKYKSLGAGPASGDNGAEMFFNYWGAAITSKFFIQDRNAKKGIYMQGDYYFVTQFTQKYRQIASSFYDHQFAIGSGLAFGAGYDLPIGKNRNMITIGLEYETDRRQGEVTSIGNKQFKSSNFGLMVGLKF